MTISTLTELALSNAYGILCAPLNVMGDRDGMYPTYCSIEPNTSTTRHAHYEPELFYIIKGSGLISINEVTNQVEAGDLIRLTPFATHVLKNTGTENLLFISIYSEDYELEKLPASVVITSAPPTPNGPLHLGHISGPYLVSDIMRRYLQLRAKTVQNICGTDDHQNYVAEKAFINRVAHHDFCDQMRHLIHADLQHMAIEFDEFIAPNKSIAYQEQVKQFAKEAIRLNVIQKEIVDFPFCEQCNHLLVDAKILGTCSFCNELGHGACENCGMVSPPYELQHPICCRCLNEATKKTVPVYTFVLSDYLNTIYDELKRLQLPLRFTKLINHISKIDSFKVLVMYQDTTHGGIVLHDLQQMIHVWFEMAAHYSRYALNDSHWVHCFGFDNGFYYLMFIPALLRAMNKNAKLPDSIITNDFLQLSGNKFSTSRNHAIWVNEFKGNIDHLRLYLSLIRPSHTLENFALSQYQQFSRELEQQLVALNERAYYLANQQFITSITPQKLIDCNRITKNIERYLSLSHIDLRRVAREIITLLDLVKQAEGMENNEKMMIHLFAMIITPIMPNESAKLFAALNVPTTHWIKDWSNLYAIN